MQFITVHFYRAIRYGFHRCVDSVRYAHFQSHSFGRVEVPLRILPSFPLAHQVTPTTRHNSVRLTSLTRLYRPGHTTTRFLWEEDVKKTSGSRNTKLTMDYRLPLHTPLPQEAADIMYYSSIPMALCLVGVALYCWVFAMLPWM
jgi:hypothetical protein